MSCCILFSPKNICVIIHFLAVIWALWCTALVSSDTGDLGSGPGPSGDMTTSDEVFFCVWRSEVVAGSVAAEATFPGTDCVSCWLLEESDPAICPGGALPLKSIHLLLVREPSRKFDRCGEEAGAGDDGGDSCLQLCQAADVSSFLLLTLSMKSRGCPDLGWNNKYFYCNKKIAFFKIIYQMSIVNLLLYFIFCTKFIFGSPSKINQMLFCASR